MGGYTPGQTQRNANARQPRTQQRTGLAKRITTAKSAQAGNLVGIMGPPEVGKTTLACLAPKAVVIDLEGSTRKMEGVARICNEPGQPDLIYEDVLGIVEDPEIHAQFDTIVVDSMTLLEALVQDFVVRTIEHEKGVAYKKIENIEDYGFGKGEVHKYHVMCDFILKCREVASRGMTIVHICHTTVDEQENPAGDDYKKYVPYLYESNSGKFSTRKFWLQQCDHVWGILHNINIKGGKAQQTGGRTLYPSWNAWIEAKSRLGGLKSSMLLKEGDTTPWDVLFGKKKEAGFAMPTIPGDAPDEPQHSTSAPEFD